MGISKTKVCLKCGASFIADDSEDTCAVCSDKEHEFLRQKRCFNPECNKLFLTSLRLMNVKKFCSNICCREYHEKKVKERLSKSVSNKGGLTQV